MPPSSPWVELTIDMANPYGPEVRLGGRSLTGQWVEFYALLALARSAAVGSGDFIDVRQLHRMASWGGTKRLSSVGKEVARHCKGLERRGEVVIDSKQRTKLWRLALDVSAIHFRPSREVVERWVRARTRGPELGTGWIMQLEHMVLAQLALQTGEGARARDQLRGLSDFVTPELDAWAALIDARGTDQFVEPADNPNVLDSLIEAWSGRSDAVAQSVAAQISARAAMRKRFSDPSAAHAELERHAAELERRGDVAALAAVINVLGILANRCGRPEQAAQHHLRAAALFGIVGNYHSLEGTLFNAANAWVAARGLAGQGPDGLALRLLDLARDLATTLGVGRDTIQTEVLAAHWAIDIGELSRARTYVEAAAAIIPSLDSGYEQGCYLMARARLELLDPRGDHDPVRDLRAARRAFEAAGARGPIEGVETMLDRALREHR